MLVEVIAITDDSTLNAFFSIGYYLALVVVPLFGALSLFKS